MIHLCFSDGIRSMKDTISQLIDDFQEREVPALVRRDKELHEITDKASVVIGMRRAGKTWFCCQKLPS